MKRFLFLVTAAAALAIPAAAVAAAPPTAGSLATQSCKAQQAQLGAATFKSTYGANAYGKCVSKATKSSHTALVNAAAACKAEQADTAFALSHDTKTFDAFYGGNTKANGKGADANAYGKCVAKKAQATVLALTQKTVAGAKACKAELTLKGKAAFATVYGSKANAFGVCVSRKLAA
jgi:hypothetical protein